MTLTVGSLFSGIGGLDLGLERAGMRVIWQSEIDPYANQVLAKHWLTIPNHGNIKEIDWTQIERPDIICGGYPCQPFSQAGHRKGEEDPRHLWPWVRDAISALRPRYAILENVRGHLSLGGTTVLADLAAIGYDAEWDIISAQSVGANHRRDRIFIVAYPNDPRSRASRDGVDFNRPPIVKGWQNEPFSRASRFGENVADSDIWQTGWGNGGNAAGRGSVFGGEHQRRGTARDASRQWWEVEPGVGRVADGVSRRVDRLKCLGNAVVPQVAEYVGRLVKEHADEQS